MLLQELHVAFLHDTWRSVDLGPLDLLCLSWQYWGRLDKESRKDPHAWQHCQERAGRAQRKYLGWDSEEEVVVEDEHSA